MDVVTSPPSTHDPPGTVALNYDPFEKKSQIIFDAKLLSHCVRISDYGDL